MSLGLPQRLSRRSLAAQQARSSPQKDTQLTQSNTAKERSTQPIEHVPKRQPTAVRNGRTPLSLRSCHIGQAPTANPAGTEGSLLFLSSDGQSLSLGTMEGMRHLSLAL